MARNNNNTRANDAKKTLADVKEITPGELAKLAEASKDTLATIVANVGKYQMSTPAGVKSIAAALIKDGTSMTTIKAAQKAVNTFTGGKFADIKKAVQAARLEAVAADLKASKEVISYDNILNAAFAEVQKVPSFAALCSYAQSTFDNAAALVAAYYPAVDASTGLPLTVTSYIDSTNTTIATYYTQKALTASAAVNVIMAALNALAKHGKSNIKDSKWQWHNCHTPGTICAVYGVKVAEDGTLARGAKSASVDGVPVELSAAAESGWRPLAEVNAAKRGK